MDSISEQSIQAISNILSCSVSANFIRIFNQLTKNRKKSREDEFSKTLHVFHSSQRNGDFYAFYGQDAVWLAQSLFQTNTVLKYTSMLYHA